MIDAILLAVIAGGGSEVDYARDVKPILASRCTSCHGSIRQKAGFRLDAAALIRRGGDGGPAVEPGRSGESLIVERVTTADAADRMPPESEGVPLSPAEVSVLRAWIDHGAKASPEPTPEDPRRYWAFQPPRRPTYGLGALCDDLPQCISLGPALESQCMGGVDANHLDPEHAGVVLKVDPNDPLPFSRTGVPVGRSGAAIKAELLGLDSRRLEIPGRKRLEVEHGRPIRQILA